MKPSDFNLPAKFTDFQPGQVESILGIAASMADNRFTLFSGPTGSGKSLMVIVSCILSGGRALILTGKKALQDQYVADFRSMGLVEVRGQANYTCLALEPDGELAHLRPFGAKGSLGCDKGPCREGVRCDLKVGGCGKYDAVREANRSRLVVSNYAYRISMARFNPTVLGEFDLLILDEAHEAASWVEQYNTAEFTGRGLKNLIEATLPQFDKPWLAGKKKRLPNKYERVQHQKGWAEWASKTLPVARKRLEILESCAEKDYKQIVKMKDLITRLKIVTTPDVDWSIESTSSKATLTPTWVGPLCESNLFCGVPKVILTSATLSEEVAKYTGIESRDYKYTEMPSRFSYKRRPILYAKYPKGAGPSDPNRKVCMRYGMPIEDELLQIQRIDQIIEDRQDRKGLILPVTYDRTNLILKHSRWAKSGVLFGHRKGSTNVENAVGRFRDSESPSCIVSPVLGEGFDFKDDQCRYLIIPKIPMIPIQTLAMKERCRQDSNYSNYLTALNVVQWVGRLIRGPLDWGEVIILDGQWEWFFDKANFAKWFERACFSKNGLPKPMKVPE